MTVFVHPDDAPVRVLLVDDHALFRRGLALVLGAESDIEVVGEASHGVEAVERAAELQPDVVVMDVRMPGMGGVEATRRIRQSQPAIRVVMLTGSTEDEDLFGALRAGASGYLLKEVAIEEIAAAVLAIARGRALVSPSMTARLVAEFNALSRRVDEQDDHAPRLTDRELEVLRLVARGMANKEIAAELVIAENTVKNHVRNILEKLQVRTRMEAALYAVRERLVDTA